MEHRHKKNKKSKDASPEIKQTTSAKNVDVPAPTFTLIHSLTDLSKSGLRRPFKIADDFPTRVAFPFKDHVATNYHRDFLLALKDNTKISDLHFSGHPWKQDEINALVDALSTNTSVTSIEFFMFTLGTIFVEGLVRMLKKNTHIQNFTFKNTTMTIPTWTRFCDGLEYYNFSTFNLSYCSLDEPRMVILKDYMIFNSSIKTLIVDGERMGGRIYNIFCSMLAKQPRVEKLMLNFCLNNQTEYEAFNMVLKANTLKSWIMKGTSYYGPVLDRIREELGKNTSLTELAIQTCTYLTDKDVFKILERNRGIKKLDVSSGTALYTLDLAENTTLTDLSVGQCYNLTISSIVRALSHNTTLKILRFGTNDMDDVPSLEQYLKNTTTLEEIYFDLIHSHQVRLSVQILENVFKVNKSIRKLVIPLHALEFPELHKFIESLRENTTLTALDMGPYDLLGKKDRPTTAGVDDLLLDMLKTNKTLRYVEGANHLTPLVKNRRTQENTIGDTRWFIGLILKKRNSFILPIEVWLRVFKYFSYSFTSYDFEQFFDGLLKK